MSPPRDRAIREVLSQIRELAVRYYDLTGRPLGVTGEVAENEAIRLIGLELAPVREAGYDAVRRVGTRKHKIQIKGRCVLNSNLGQRLGSIDITKPWDSVLLVLLNRSYEVTAMYEAPRKKVVEALTAPGSKARNERGALSISKFKSIAKEVWTCDAA